MIYLFSRCYGGLFHRHMIMLKPFYLLYTSFMLNDQSTDIYIYSSESKASTTYVYVDVT